MRPVPTYLLKRISDDIERAIRHVERGQMASPEVTQLDAAWAVLNEMRVYVNDAWKPMDLADAEEN